MGPFMRQNSLIDSVGDFSEQAEDVLALTHMKVPPPLLTKATEQLRYAAMLVEDVAYELSFYHPEETTSFLVSLSASLDMDVPKLIEVGSRLTNTP